MKEALFPIVECLTVRLPKIVMRCIKADLSRTSTVSREKPCISAENGFRFALEGGGHILMEKKGTKMFPPRAPANHPIFLLENSNMILQENGYKIQLENND